METVQTFRVKYDSCQLFGQKRFFHFFRIHLNELKKTLSLQVALTPNTTRIVVDVDYEMLSTKDLK